MKVSEIEELLVEYYNGETNEAEESEIKRFFAEEQVPSHLLAERDFFLGLHGQQDPKLPEGLEAKLSTLIDEWDTRERRMQRVKKHARLMRLQWIGSMAAGLLILVSVGTYLHHSYTPLPTPRDTCKTPEEAYAQAQKALIMLSAGLNKGVEGVEALQETTWHIEKNINEQLNHINNIEQ